MSKIEERFEKLFIKAKIKYVREKSFKDLRNGALRYDFYFPELNILCEIDSMIHF